MRFLWLIVALPVMAQDVEFNRDIRPILSDKCYTCHGPSSVSRKAGLRFDIERGATKVIVPGKSAESEIFRRISSEDKARRMPPAYAGAEKLSDAEIDKVKRWIDQGAKWQLLWSFIPPVRTARPKVSDAAWVRNEIDAFVLAKLDREGLTHSPEADRRTLIRRVSLDLTGLPPSPAEVDAFVADSSAGAYEKLVDRLLASPRYGERMAFRWMEAARYADTNGYSNDGVREMWPWRDWVIRAFNSNLPYDQFTLDQIAGDLLPNATLDQQIATGFNRNHRTSAEGGIVPEEFRVDYAADRTETTATVWMGLTVGCARCHDHKYDPIPQRDYYRMFAYFNSVPGSGFAYNFGNDEPKIKAPNPEQQKRLAELDAARLAARARWTALDTAAPKCASADWTITEGQVFRQEAAQHFDGKSFFTAKDEVANFEYNEPFTFAARIKPDAPQGAILSHADDFMEGQGHGLYLIDGKLRLHVIFRWSDLGMRVETEEPVKLHAWQHVLVSYDGNMRAKGVHMYVDGREQKLKVLFDENIWPLKGKRPFRIGGGAGLRFEGDIADVRVFKRELSSREAAVVAMPASGGAAEADRVRFCYLETGLAPALRTARDAMLAAEHEYAAYLKTVPTTMVMQDMSPPRPTFVLKRGAYDAHGEEVEPGILSVFPPINPAWPKNRLGLARWLVDRGNPFTARVTVNRFWQLYFGAGIVKTVQDFGSQGDAPVNQELLDWLAVDFMDSGWDVKALQKKIVMSATYQQASKITPEALQKDPENRLLSHGPRLRLTPDIIRDQALYFAGLLVEKVGGPTVKPYQPPGLWQELAGGKGYVPDKGEGLYRRSLYTFWKRTVAPPFMINFDSPNREMCTVNQVRTNTPLQALNLMNDVAFLEAARKLGERMMKAGGPEFGWQVAVGRPATTAQKQVLRDTLARFEQRYRGDAKAASEYLANGESARDTTLPVADLAAYTAVASLILNLDEVITNE